MIKHKNIIARFSGILNRASANLHVIVLYKLIIKTVIAICIIPAFFSCGKPEITANFKDQEKLSIYDYMVVNSAKYSSFLRILEAGKIAKTLSAYNPNGTGYTLFLPDNETINKYIQQSGTYSNLDELVADTAYVRIFGRYHIVDMSINTNDFPFGALPEYTLSGDLLTVSFVNEPDTSYYKINNQSPVVLPNVELSNGYVHVINTALSPVVYTTYGWLELHPGYTILKDAIDATGLKTSFDINIKLDKEANSFTFLAEPDSVFARRNINSFEDLANYISPGNTDYTNVSNPLNNFIRYHQLTDTRFLDNFVDVITNYSTYSEIPLNINGSGLDIAINKGKQNFDTLISGIDTTIIDFVGFYYDNSNILTQSGVVHFINQILTQQKPSRAIQTFQFYEEALFNEFRLVPGTYLVEDSTSLNTIKYKGVDLFFVKSDDAASTAWSGDYIMLNGDFSITYKIPKLVQGSYTVFLGADAFNTENALIEISIDGIVMGGLLDLSTGGSSAYPFAQTKIGTIDFIKYEQHTIGIKSLIPGKFNWDYIRFEPL